MAQPLRKPVFVKIDQLNPSSTGINLNAVVVSRKLIVHKKRADGFETKVAEVKLGDETGCVNFIARQKAEELCQEGVQITIRNARVRMMERNNSSFLQLEVDRWGKVEQSTVAVKSTNAQNDLSAVEYELVSK